MKKIVICALAGLALVAAASPSLAAGHGLYTGVGTLGYNLGYKFSVTKSLGLRVGVNTFKYSDKIKQGDVEYKGDLKLNSVELTADWHPFGNGFALTGGVLVNDNKFTGDARPTLPGQLKVGDRVFSGADPRARVVGKLGDGVTPYVGLGYTLNPVAAKGLRFNVGLGVVMQDPEVKLTVSGVNDPTGRLEDERLKAERDLQKELDDLKTYPVVTVGFSYAF